MQNVKISKYVIPTVYLCDICTDR